MHASDVMIWHPPICMLYSSQPSTSVVGVLHALDVLNWHPYLHVYSALGISCMCHHAVIGAFSIVALAMFELVRYGIDSMYSI